MITKDYHIHTNYSPDADNLATFKKYIEKAKKIGLEEIIFTDHIDFDAAHPLFEKPINYDEYIKDYNQVKQSTNFPIKLGVEIGYQSHTIQENKDFLKKYPFEYVVLSIHYIDKQDLYTKEFFKGKTKKEAYNRYFNICLEAIQNIDEFTTFGHLDYIPRYSELGDYEYDDYKDIIDKILQALINKNKNLEINTSGYKTENRPYPKKEVIDRYIELGGKNIVYGSDAHTVHELGYRFKDIKKRG